MSELNLHVAYGGYGGYGGYKVLTSDNPLKPWGAPVHMRSLNVRVKRGCKSEL